MILICSFIIDANNWLCIYYFFQVMSVLNELQIWTFPWGKFYVPITLSLFDLFKWSGSFLLTFDIMVVHLLFLDSGQTFLPCFFLDNIYLISIFFYCKIVPRYNWNELKIDKTLNAIGMDWSCKKSNDWLNFLQQIFLLTICLRTTVNSL